MDRDGEGAGAGGRSQDINRSPGISAQAETDEILHTASGAVRTGNTTAK